MGGTGRFAGMYVLLAALGIAVVLNMSTTGLGAVNSALHKAKESGPGRWVASTWEQHAPAVQASLQRAKDSEAGQWVASLVERYIPSAHELLMSFSLGNVNLATGGAMPPPGRSRQAGECKVEAGVEPDAQTEKGAEEAQRLEVVKAEGAAEACSCGDIESSDCSASEEKPSVAEERRLDECCCSHETTEHLNMASVYPKLTELIEKPFFRYFKINLYTQCPLWPDDGQCMLETCAVEECDDGEIPLPWKLAEAGQLDLDVACTLQQGRNKDSMAAQEVDTNMDAGVRFRLSHVPDWKGVSNPWMVEEEEGDFIYVDLTRNPEKNTGYKGEHARKVWAAIYGQKCFENINSPDSCQEDKVFYKLVSGVHTSITTHTLPAHLLKHRLGAEWAKPFVDNLHFSFLFILRAVMKAGPLLEKMTYFTGNPNEDAATHTLIENLVGSSQAACPIPFDEGRMWRGEDSDVKKEELRLQLHNVTRAMDCVGCDKCKMWAKLRMLGVAAAFKILFSVDDCMGDGGAKEMVLERNEVIALINLLAQFSSSIEAVRTMHDVPDPPSEPQPSDSPFG